MSAVDRVWINATLASLEPNGTPYGLFNDAAIAMCGDTIVWRGPVAELPNEYRSIDATLDCEGRLVTPGLIDCHTHLVYGGDRVAEYEQLLNGVSYADIARAGGGIRSTVRATRNATDAELYRQSQKRLQNLMSEGVTTIEIKSGYGLDTETEMRMLRVARHLGDNYAITVKTSFLGAHALPESYTDRPDAYIDLVCNDMLPAVAAESLADAVDAFCEGIGFTPAQVERVFQAARKHQLPVKLHAEQLSDLKGARLAAKYRALSVDHLEYLNTADIPELAAAGTVAVLLPGAFYHLRETQVPPIQGLRDGQVEMALASDSNPGSSPVQSLLMMLNMGCNLFRMTPEEALAGVTRHAATALGLSDRIGTVTAGKYADLVLWDIQHPAELSYRIGGNPCMKVLYRGQPRNADGSLVG